MQGKSHPLLNHGRLQPLGQRGLHLRRFWAMWLLHPAFLFYHAVYQTFHGNIEPCAFNDSDSQQHLNAELNHQLYFHRNHTQNQTKPRSRPARLPPHQMPGSSVESLHEVFRFKDEAMGQSPKREVPKRGPKNSHARGLFRAKLQPTKSSPKGPYKPQWNHYMTAV